jgi:hypothetical protein
MANSRWITIRQKFDYYWPGRTAITAYVPAEIRVLDEVADFAVAKGYATEGKADGSDATPPAPKKATRRRKPAKKAAPAKEIAAATTADTGPAEGVGDSPVPDVDSAVDRSGVDHDAG